MVAIEVKSLGKQKVLANNPERQICLWVSEAYLVPKWRGTSCSLQLRRFD